MYAFAPVGASLMVLVVGIVAARHIQTQDPLVSVSQLTRSVAMGVTLFGPFVLDGLNLLPVGDAGGWEAVVPLALGVVLYLPVARVVGIAGETQSSASGTGC
jgi:hypothetical protein